MKVFLQFALITALAFSCMGAEQEVTEKKAVAWHEDFAVAQKVAEEKKLPLLMLFTGSDWCYWCKLLDARVLSQQHFLDYAEKNLVLFKADFPKKNKNPKNIKEQNDSLAKKYNIEGFPTIIILDQKGKLLATTGITDRNPTPEKYVEHLEKLIHK